MPATFASGELVNLPKPLVISRLIRKRCRSPPRTLKDWVVVLQLFLPLEAAEAAQVEACLPSAATVAGVAVVERERLLQQALAVEQPPWLIRSKVLLLLLLLWRRIKKKESKMSPFPRQK